MIALKRDSKTPYYVPDYLATAITDIDFKRLSREGIKYVAFDADSTLVNYRGAVVAPAVRKYLSENRRVFNKWCIASNRITNDLAPIAKVIDADLIQANILIRKPDIHFFHKVLQHFGAKPGEVVMIGDKLIADIYGAKRAGFKTVWVEHIGRDSFLDRFLHVRRLEKWLLKKFKPGISESDF